VGGDPPQGIVSVVGEAVDNGADLQHLIGRGWQVPAQFEIQARGNLPPLRIGGKLLEADGDTLVTPVALIPGSHPAAIDAKNVEPARVSVSVVVGADVLDVHGVTACDEP